jgi:uncharacterized protein (DUF58 family)
MNKKLWLLLPVFFVLAFFAVLVGGTVPYFLLYSFLLSVSLPLGISLLSLYNLKGMISIPASEYNKGDLIPIEYEIKNRTFFSIPLLELTNDAARALSGKKTKSVTVSLSGREAFRRRELVVAARRGFYSFGEINVNLRDAFGLSNFKRIIRDQTSILIFPEVIEISTFHISASHESGELLINDRMYQDRSRITAIREYREGDTSKSIHWRLSASRENPVVKEFENRGDADVAIFMENSSAVLKNDVDRRLEDLEVDISLSIINYCLDHNVGVQLHFQERSKDIIVTGSQPTALRQFLEAMARFSANGEASLNLLIKEKARELSRGSNLIVITPALDSLLGAKLLELSSQGFKPNLILVSDYKNKSGYINESVERKIRQEGIKVITVDCTSDRVKTMEVGHE